MKSNCLAVLLLALPLVAQGDRITKTDGTSIDNVAVVNWDIREIKYRKAGSTTSLGSDKVLKVELEAFSDVFRIALRDGGLMLTKAREQIKEGEELLAQLGFVAAAALFFDKEQPKDGIAALEEMEKEFPTAGTLPEIYRQKYDHYMNSGGQGGMRDAEAVAKKYLVAAQGNAWPAGFALEAEFQQAYAQHLGGGDAGAFQKAMNSIADRARTENPLIGNRASVQLANSLRVNKNAAGARKIYESIITKEGVDSSSLGGSYLGLGLIEFEAAGNNQAAHKKAMLWFLRVYLETRGCWPSLQAEALYYAALAAGKWRGTEFEYIMAKCRGVLKNEFPQSDWTTRALQGR
jgi:hypothetical protein